jgi:hypothetical protein
VKKKMSRLKRLQNKHDGETCVVIGNGASLKDIDLARLSEKYATFGSNRIYLFPFVPMYYAIADDVMLMSCIQDIVKPGFCPAEMFINSNYPIPMATPVNYAVRYDFSFDIERDIVIGGTVTYVLLQIAYYMGFKKALLVGVDHYYPSADKGKPGTKFIQSGQDVDHFHPDYFKDGMIYNRPELAATEKMYTLAKNVFESNGRKIINLTTKTNLLVYDKEDVNKYY